MTAKREAIFAEIERRLGLIAGVAEVERMPSGDPSAFPALAIEDVAQSVDSGTEPGVNRYSLRVEIDGFVRGGNGAGAHAESNALYLAVVAALITEPPLGGLAETIEEADFRAKVAELANSRRIGFSLEFSIEFVGAKSGPVA